MTEKKQISIATLKPNEVWKNFYALTQIPRPSKKEKKAAEYILHFGEKLGLKSVMDEIGNVIISKPATPGMEKCKGIILQAHIDMVPQANNDKKHDFEKDPIEAYIDGEWVTANGTTLGADNGIGVAAAMAVLESKNLEHGPLEVLITIDEETGMTGANNLSPAALKGEILINLDSEDEGELYVGCAGGLDGTFTFEYQKEKMPEDFTSIKLNVTELEGGHSGMDIILGRANANKTIFRLLKILANKLNARLASIEGGNIRNAIPREAVAVVAIEKNREEELNNIVNEFQKIIKSEYAGTDKKLKILVEKTKKPEEIIDKKTQTALTDAIYGCPNGVVRMSDAMPGLVETSNNLAIVKSESGKIQVKCLMRSSVDSAKLDLAEAMESVFRQAGAKVEFSGGYSGWKPNIESSILAVMQKTYKELYNKIPEIKAIHAGLECGIFGGIYPHWDMISFGPTIRHPHSPAEKVNIESVDKFWKFLTATLKNAPKKE
ncbi:MAG: aminoacyl-histidine dipeptidase [Prevotellaceae bacterium]|jgi:dipeptidase D|nr:aminoacyl-histidine dipeptidase [Prevotellaceae bacterium]